MSGHVDPHVRLLTIVGLVHRCAQETELFFQRKPYDPRYCFELFRRAIVGRNQQAWESIYGQYLRLVTGWVQRHPLHATSGEEAQFFANSAFEKMWTALTPEKFERFPDLKSVLRYLQMCVHSAIVDYVRQAAYTTEEFSADLSPLDDQDSGADLEAQVLGQVNNEEFWRLISERLNDDKERRVVYGCFILDLKPRELHAQSGRMFADVSEIYRVKQNVLTRLRRDPALAKFLLEDA